MKFKRNLLLTFTGTALLLNNVTIYAQDSLKQSLQPIKKVYDGPRVSVKSFGKGLKFTAEDSTFQFTIHGRFQTLLVAEKALDEGKTEATTNFLIRRARLKFDGFAFNPNITFKMELGLSNRDWVAPIPETNNTPNMILDAVLKFKIAKNLSVWFGQTKLPGNRERVISSQQLQFVDRSLVNSNYNIDRDAGIQLHHHFKIGNAVIREIASICSGEGRNITVSNRGGYDYTGRIEILPFGNFTNKGDYFGSDLEREKTPKLALGGTYDYNDNASREQGQLGSFLSRTTDLKSVMLDLMFKYKGVSIMTEYIDKQSKDPVVTDTLGTVLGVYTVGTGISTQIGYLFPSNVEIAGRYSNNKPDVKIGENILHQYTLGISKYIKGHDLKIQTDITITDEETVADLELMYRFQIEMAF